MLDKDVLVKVTNRDNGSVGYVIPDLNNLHRNFQSGETKEVTMNELRKLSYIPGGEEILRNYLIIHNEDAVKELLNQVEPEYYYTEADVKNLLLNGSLDALKDCLEFAPKGTIDLVKKLAIEMPLNDIAKRKAILEMTGFNVDAAIMVNEETKEESDDTQKVRRISEPVKEEVKSTGRRTAVPTVSESKYKILDK